MKPVNSTLCKSRKLPHLQTYILKDFTISDPPQTYAST